MNSPSALLAPAKINLVLRVLRKRDDGYHDIFSVMQPVSLYDEIFIEAGPGEGISISSGSIEVPSDNSNLAYRAAEVFLKKSGIKKRVGIRIKKNIPVAAGLGGGSSDGAAVLMGLNVLLKTGFDEAALMDMASSIGSDAPFFILNSPAVATGRGTVLRRASLPQYHYILVNPGFKVPTKWVYDNLDLTKKFEDNILTYSEESLNDIERLKDCLINDLEAVTLRRFPEILAHKNALIEAGASGALQSGSGPTVFGVFRDGGEAAKAFNNLKQRLPGSCSIFLVRGL